MLVLLKQPFTTRGPSIRVHIIPHVLLSPLVPGLITLFYKWNIHQLSQLRIQIHGRNFKLVQNNMEVLQEMLHPDPLTCSGHFCMAPWVGRNIR